MAQSLRDDQREKLMSAAHRASGSWPVEVIESGCIISCTDKCEMICVMFPEVYNRRKDLLNG